MEQITLAVKGMSCQHCVSAIEGAVGEQSGVDSVKVHLDKGEVDITFNADEVGVEQIKELIEDQGYDVV
jgi:copper chaperone